MPRPVFNGCTAKVAGKRRWFALREKRRRLALSRKVSSMIVLWHSIAIMMVDEVPFSRYYAIKLFCVKWSLFPRRVTYTFTQPPHCCIRPQCMCAHTISVTIRSTTFLPVRGRVHSSSILWAPPCNQITNDIYRERERETLAVCSIVMTTLVLGEETRSMAPPIPFTIFPGIIQLARSPYWETCSGDY